MNHDHGRDKRNNPRRAATLMARQVHRWISRALVKQVCPVCGGSLDRSGCECGAFELEPSDFQLVAEED